MKTQNIEVEGLPEGWRAVAYRIPFENKDYILHGEQVLLCCWPTDKKYLIVEKIQPRKIVLEETMEERSVSYGEWFEYDGLISQWPDEKYGSNISYKVWHEVKETGIPLTNEEPKLSLSVAECKAYLEDAYNLDCKIIEFIKDNEK